MVYPTKDCDRRRHKSGINSAGNRRRRNETNIQIRKDKRAAGLSRRRAASVPAINNSGIDANGNATSAFTMIAAFLSNQHKTMTDDLVHLLTKAESASSSSTSNLKNQYVAKGSSALTIDRSSTDVTQMESFVLDCGIVPYLLSTLAIQCPVQLWEECVVYVGNLAGSDSVMLRNHLLDHNAMRTLISLAVSIEVEVNQQSQMHLQLLEKIIWCVSNLCRGRPKPNSEHVSIAIPYLSKIFNNTPTPTSKSTGGEIFASTCWTLFYLSEGSDEKVLDALDRCDIFARLFSIIAGAGAVDHHNPQLILVSLQILSNFALGDGSYVEKLWIDNRIECISQVLNSSKRDVVVEALFLLSNVVDCEGDDQVDKMISSPTLMSILMNFLQSGHQDVRLECLWIIGNIASSGTEKQLQKLVQLGLVPLLCQNLEFYNTKTVLMLLDTIDEILLVGERLGEDYRLILDEHGGVDMIESLQTHLNDDVYRRSVEIIESHFGEDDEWDEEM